MPIIPIAANNVLDIMNIKPNDRNLKSINSLKILDHDKELGKTEILFKKIDNDN